MNAIDTIRAALSTSYEWNKQLANDLLDAPLTPPTSSGGNHPLWVMGHLAFSRAGLLSMINGQPSSLGKWKDLFAGGTQPQSEPKVYPPYSEVLSAYQQTHRDTLRLLEEIGEANLDARPKAVMEKLRDMPDFQSNGRLFLFIAMHDMSHRGQLADARHALGRQPFV
jgi:hypothetical protein